MTSVTIRDVAKRAGVGIGTVSRVLNDNPSVRKTTRQKVLAAIADLDYSPNPIARRLSLRKTLTIAVIVPFFTRPSFVERLRGVEYALADSEYDLILFNVETTARRDDYFRSVPRRERVDGLLVISLSPHDADVEHFLQANVPTVLVDARHPRLSRAVVDDVAGGHLATQHLIDLGHRKIGYVSDCLKNPFNFVSSRDRYEGYRQALAEAGIPFRPEYHCQGEHGRREAREMASVLLSLPDRPTAIFAASDIQAIGVLEASRDAGLKVPDDLSVIGYDDIEISEYLHLTTIRQPLFVSGVEGVGLLLESIATPPPTPRRVLLPTELVIRDTTIPLS
ncbi:MAG: LacI family DNA-binding transcriptional regulator [Chloroflexota bacterium]|nr:LacI family DNA-binding transcriptional regulator [Chloroflexota bacterium]